MATNSGGSNPIAGTEGIQGNSTVPPKVSDEVKQEIANSTQSAAPGEHASGQDAGVVPAAEGPEEAKSEKKSRIKVALSLLYNQDALREKGLFLDKKDNLIKVPACERSKGITEPILRPRRRTGVKVFAQPAPQVVRDGKIKLQPESAEKSYIRWLENINDWCISRELWWAIDVLHFAKIDGSLRETIKQLE
ncbi:tRNA synthetases class I domain-containing protein [Trichoderma chlorosporum]